MTQAWHTQDSLPWRNADCFLAYIPGYVVGRHSHTMHAIEAQSNRV